MADTTPPPFPLPDLPRAPASELGSLAVRILEWRDMEAFTRLPDMLMDMGRNEDAKMVKFCCHHGITWQYQSSDTIQYKPPTWGMIASTVSSLLWWDIFDWQSTLRVMGEKFGKTPVGRKGQITLPDDTIVNIQNWVLNSGGQIEVALRDPDESP